MTATEIAALAITAVCMSYVVTHAVHRHAHSFGLIDVPNGRSLHAVPTPRGGGLSVVCVTLGALLFGSFADLEARPFVLVALIVGGFSVSAVSLLNDIGEISARKRLFVHLGLGTSAVALVGPIPAFQLGTHLVTLGWIAVPLTVVWIAGVINAYNFMDGVDDLAAGQSIAAGGGWTIVALIIGRPEIATVALSIAASSAGFVIHNWTRGRVFLGDVGSTFLGYIFALLTVIAAHDDAKLASAGVIFLWPFIFDATLTLVRRALRAENLLGAHRSHYYQRLVRAGWTHLQVSALYFCLAILSAALGIGAAIDVRGSATAALFLLPSMAGAIWFIVRWRETSSVAPINIQ